MSTTITVGTTTITPQLILGYEVSRRSGNRVHIVPGRPDPDATLRPALLRTGTLTLLFLNEIDAWLAHDALCLGEVCSLTSDELSGISMQFVLDQDGEATVALDVETRKRWTVTFDFQEVDV